MTVPFRFMWMTSWGPSGWESPDFTAYDWRRPELYGEMAKILENRGGFEALILDDTPFLPSDRDVAERHIEFGGRGVVHDPTPLLSAVSYYTRHLGLVTTAATATWPPFLLARALGTLDHMSYGRAGWHVDASFYRGVVENYGLDGRWSEEDRYERTEEFFEVCRALWESWDEDAVLLDRARGRFADGSKVHVTNFEGKYFDVRGPMTHPRPPQHVPVIAHSDVSERGQAFAAAHADLVVVKAPSTAAARTTVEKLRAGVVACGRDPGDVRIFVGVRAFVAATNDDADVRRTRLVSTPAAVADPHDDIIVVSGDPQCVSRQLCDVIDASGADGLTVCDALTPTAVIALVDTVIPILRAEGLVRTGYRHQHFRDNLRDADFVGLANELPGGIK